MFLHLVFGWPFVRSLVSDAGVLVSVARPLRLAGLAFVAFRLQVPLDVRRREDDPGTLWVHVAAMPVLDPFGLVGHVERRRRRTSE